MLLRLRNRVHRRLDEEENLDEDADGIYRQPAPARGGPDRHDGTAV
ncbi:MULTISPECIES: hypothetical protein [unclassified Streptomyces]|nr:hypothetical protein [Streptomyces sp. ST1015]